LCWKETLCVCGDKWNTIRDKPISGQTGATATSVNEQRKCYLYVEYERKENTMNKG